MRAIAASRRIFALACAASVALIGGIQPVPAAAPTDRTLFAADGFQVVTVNTDAGSETLVADLTSTLFAPGPLFADPSQPRLYALGSEVIGGGKALIVFNNALTIDTTTDSVQASPTLVDTIAGGVAFDPATKSLLAVRLFDPVCCSNALERIDIATGAESVVAQVPYVSPFIDAVAMDPSSGTLYMTTPSLPFTGSPGPVAIVTVDTHTGATSTSPFLADDLTQLVFEPKRGVLLGLTGSNPERLVQVDPATGAETAVASLPGNTVIDDLALVPKAQILVGLAVGAPDRLAVIDLHNGTTQFGPSLQGFLSFLAFQQSR